MILYILYTLSHDHSEQIPYQDAETAANKEVTGIYPGEGHEAVHAQIHGDNGEGHSFHEHQERYGPLHELNGEFNDGHSRLEHQEMYKNNGGLNEHAMVRSRDGAGLGDVHSAVLLGNKDGFGGHYGYEEGGDAYGEHGNSGLYGAHGALGHGFCNAHGFNGFHHGNGTPYEGHGGADGHAVAAAGYGGYGPYGAAGYGGYGGAAGYGGAPWGGNGAYGPNGLGGYVGDAGYGVGHGYGNIDGYGGQSYGAPGGYGGLRGVCAGGVDGHLNGHLDNNHANFGPNGLLAPAYGELSLGGAYHVVNDGWGHPGVRFFSGPEHGMYHDMLGQGVPANVVDFYNDNGVIDPATGEYVGGYMHGDSFKGPARRSHKALELARNMAIGNGFRRVLIGENAFGRLHGHYGEGGKPFAGAPAHSALEGTAEGIKTAFDGNNASDILYQQEMRNKNVEDLARANGGLQQLVSGRPSDVARSNGGLQPVGGGMPGDYANAVGGLQPAGGGMPGNVANAVGGLPPYEGALPVDAAVHIEQAHPDTVDIIENTHEKANLHYEAAKADLAMGDLGRANEHMKEGRLENLKATSMMMDKVANKNMMAAKVAAEHGDLVTAKALESSAMCMSKTGHQTVESYANSIGLANFHHDESALFGGEMHAEKARLDALEAEKLAADSVLAAAEGNTNAANGIKAAAAVMAAEGRAEGAFGKILNALSSNKAGQTRMETIENVANQNVKEAIAIQDNLNKITTNNDAPFNKSVAMTIQDLNLKNKSGAKNAATLTAGEVLKEIPADEMIKNIEVNEYVEKVLQPPPIKEAFIISNANEIAQNLIAKEAATLEEVEKQKAKAQEIELSKLIIHKPMTPIETLGIIATIPEDGEAIKIKNSTILMPIKGYEPKTATNAAEKQALEAQNRLRDDLRGKITERKFDSPLNVIKTDKGYLNLPESTLGIKIDEGRGYFSEDAKVKMEKNGIDVGSFEHKINTGEMKDMAAGLGYYVVDLSGFSLEYPTPKNPHPNMVAVGKGKLVNVEEAFAIDVKEGEIELTSWKEYLKTLRPHVNKPVIKKFADKNFKKNMKKGEEIEQKVVKMVEKDEKMLLDVANTKKQIIINPDGSAFVEVKPAYGVKELIPVEEIQSFIPSNYVTGKKIIKYGQNGVSEMRGETDMKHYEKTGAVSKQTQEVKNEKALADLALKSAIDSSETKSLISSKNAFSGEVVYKKQELINQAEDESSALHQVEKQETGASLNYGDKHGMTAFEKNNKAVQLENEEMMYQNTVEAQELKGNFAFEKHLKSFKNQIKNTSEMTDQQLIQAIEKYTHSSIEAMHEFDFMFESYNFFESRKILLDKIKKYGIDYLEWRNLLRKYLISNIVLINQLNMDPHMMYALVNKITDSILNNIRAYSILPKEASDTVKERVKRNYNDAVQEINGIFRGHGTEITSFIEKEIVNIEHMPSTKGGTIDNNFVQSLMNGFESGELGLGVDTKGQVYKKETNYKKLLGELKKGGGIKHIITKDEYNKPHEICIAELECPTKFERSKEVKAAKSTNQNVSNINHSTSQLSCVCKLPPQPANLVAIPQQPQKQYAPMRHQLPVTNVVTKPQAHISSVQSQPKQQSPKKTNNLPIVNSKYTTAPNPSQVKQNQCICN